MKVILQQEVANLGKTGDVVKVRDGYGRNFLIPRGLATLADERNVARIAHLQQVAAATAARELASARELADKLSSVAITIKREAGAENKLFGSVTNRDVAEALVAEGYNIDRKQVILPEPIRTIGLNHVPIKLHRDVQTQIKVYVLH
jgi:large subunit ribosomal protein L9